MLSMLTGLQKWGGVQPATGSLNFPSLEVLPEKADRDQYELLCLDNTRKPVDQYEDCYLAWIPSHAVVARKNNGKEDLIWEILKVAQVFYRHPLSCLPLCAEISLTSGHTKTAGSPTSPASS